VSFLLTRDNPDATLRCGPRFWRGRYDGDDLLLETWTEGGKPKVTRKAFPDEMDRWQALNKALDKAQKLGFILHRDPNIVKIGTAIFDAQVGDRANLFDVSPSGARLVVATHKPKAEGFDLRLIDVATGERHGIHSEKPTLPAGGAAQTFVLDVRFGTSETAVFYILKSSQGVETRRIDLAIGATEVLASYEDGDGSFMGHLRPVQGSRAHFLCLDKGGEVHLRDGDSGASLRRVAVGSGVAPMCANVALSRSGHRFALLVLPPAHPGKIHVYDFESGVRIATQVLDVDMNIPELMGFFPDETRLLVSAAYGRVLSVLDPAAGTVERHSFQDCGFGSGNPENVLCHAFSPDGSHLALGGRTPFLVRHDDWKPETTIESALEVTGLINVVHLEFSADGRWLFAGGSGQHISAFKL